MRAILRALFLVCGIVAVGLPVYVLARLRLRERKLYRQLPVRRTWRPIAPYGLNGERASEYIRDVLRSVRRES